MTSLRLARSIVLLPVANGSFCRLRHAPFRDGQRRLGAAAGLRVLPARFGVWLTTFWDWIGAALPHPCPHRRRHRFDRFRLVRGASRAVFAIARRRLLLAFGAWISVQAGRLCGRITHSRSRASALAFSFRGFGSGKGRETSPGLSQNRRRRFVMAYGAVARACDGAAAASGGKNLETREGPRPRSRAEFISREHASLRPGQRPRRAVPPPARGRPRSNCNGAPFHLGAVWSSAKAKATARSSVAASRATYSWAASWTALRMRSGSNGLLRAKPPIEQNHRALVVRRSTALICFEPKQATFSLSSCRLSRRRPARSHAGRASP